VRRIPVAVVWEREREDHALRTAAEGLLAGLARAGQLDVASWTFSRGGSWRRPATVRDVPPAFGPEGIRWSRWEALFTNPRFLAAAISARLISGPTAARPGALVGLGLERSGEFVTALGRVLDVPAVIAVLPDDLSRGWSAPARRAALRAATLLAIDATSVDRLARRGLTAMRANEREPHAAWSTVGRELGDRFVQGAETSTSRS